MSQETETKEQSAYRAGMRKGWDEAVEYFEELESVRRSMKKRRDELESA